jgi:hypothetical protein
MEENTNLQNNPQSSTPPPAPMPAPTPGFSGDIKPIGPQRNYLKITLPLAGLVLLMGTVFLTVNNALQQQDNRSRAALETNAVGLRGANSGSNSGGSSFSLGKPSGTTAGDVLIAHIALNNTSPSISPPSGWTLLRDGHFSGGTIPATPICPRRSFIKWQPVLSQAVTAGHLVLQRRQMVVLLPLAMSIRPIL